MPPRNESSDSADASVPTAGESGPASGATAATSARSVDHPVVASMGVAVVTARAIRVAEVERADLRIDPVFYMLGLSRGQAALDAGLVFFVTLFVPIVGGTFMAFVSRPTASDMATALSVPAKFTEALMAAGLCVYLCARHRVSPAAFGLHVRRWMVQTLLGGLGYVLSYAYLLATVLVLAPIIPFVMKDVEKRFDMFASIPSDQPGLIAVLLVFVVIHEELIFRGLLLPLLRRATGSWAIAVALAGGVFGMLHLAQGAIGAIQVTGLGVVLSVLFIRTRSLWAVMLAHWMFNFTQIMMLPKLLYWMERVQVESGR